MKHLTHDQVNGYTSRCAYCHETNTIYPNSHVESGVEGDFWCCGQRQFVFFMFDDLEGHWTERTFSTDDNGIVCG